MVHFYNGGKDEDYTSLVDNEISEKPEEEQTPQPVLVTELNLDFGKEAKNARVRACTENVIIVSFFYFIYFNCLAKWDSEMAEVSVVV